MLLHIIDKYENESQASIALEYKFSGCSGQIIIEQQQCPSKDDFERACDWYYGEYPGGIFDQHKVERFHEKLNCVGHELGQAMYSAFDAQGILANFLKTTRSGELAVEIRSGRPEFLTDAWETLLLPNSHVALSTEAKSFTRQFVANNISEARPELRYELQSSTVSEGTAQESPLTADNLDEVRSGPTSDPLRVLYLISRPADRNLQYCQSNLFAISQNSINRGHNIEFEYLCGQTCEQVQDRLNDTQRPFHILHFDGPVSVNSESTSLILDGPESESSLLDIATVAKSLQASKAGLLSLDGRAFFRNGQLVEADKGLAMVAQIAHQHGLGNVLGLSQYIDPWSSALCFELVLDKLCCGYSLARAVVSARQSIKENEVNLPTSLEKDGYSRWPLLVHYSMQSVTFYDTEKAESGDSQNLTTQTATGSMFGFQSELLPPLLEPSSDGDLYQLATVLVNNKCSQLNKLLSVSGESGIGKTYLLHLTSYHLVDKGAVDYAFYFDFRDTNYTYQDMQQMIAPVFEISTSEWEKVEPLVSAANCVFVLDNLPECGSCSEALSESVRQFLDKQITSGNLVLSSGKSPMQWSDMPCVNHQMNPLPLLEQKLLSVRSIREYGTGTEFSQKQWLELLKTCRGLPWMSKTVSKLLSENNAGDLAKALDDHVFSECSSNKIDRYYAWQWSSLSSVWQQFLLLSNKVPGILLEMLMVAAGQQNSFAPARSLFHELGDPDADLSEGLENLESRGFLTRFPHGRFVDRRCSLFLKTRASEPVFEHLKRSSLRLLFSQVVCEGVRILSQHVLKQPNPSISNNLLFNRRSWAEHLEKLWFGFEYKSFDACKQSLDQLLQQANLGVDSAAWSLDLIERTGLEVKSDEASMEKMLAWLKLANHAMQCETFNTSEEIDAHAVSWRQWFDRLNAKPEPREMLLMQHVLLFLERFYRSRSMQQDCADVCLKAYSVFAAYELWPQIVHALKTTALCYASMGDASKATYYEDKILAEVPFDDAPPEFKVKELVGIVSSRLARSETHGVQKLLDELRSSDTPDTALKRMEDLFENLQSDLYFLEQKYSKALPYFCRHWVRAIQGQQLNIVDGLKSRLLEVENAIGKRRFDEIFEQEVPIGTTRPREYISAYH